MKKYCLRLLTSDDVSSTSYVRCFDSISSLITFLIREYSLDGIDSVNFDEFSVITKFIDDDDDDGDNSSSFPKKSSFFKFS